MHHHTIQVQKTIRIGTWAMLASLVPHWTSQKSTELSSWDASGCSPTPLVWDTLVHLWVLTHRHIFLPKPVLVLRTTSSAGKGRWGEVSARILVWSGWALENPIGKWKISWATPNGNLLRSFIYGRFYIYIYSDKCEVFWACSRPTCEVFWACSRPTLMFISFEDGVLPLVKVPLNTGLIPVDG